MALRCSLRGMSFPFPAVRPRRPSLRAPARRFLGSCSAVVALLCGPAVALGQEDAEVGSDRPATVAGEEPRDELLEEERNREDPEETRAEARGEARDERRAAEATELVLATDPPAVRDALHKLEEAEAAQDESGLDEVKKILEAEIEAGRNVARSHNALGRAYMLEHEHAIVVFESIQKLFDWDHISRARHHFRLATEAQPDYVEAWYNWAQAGRKAKNEEALREAAVALRKTVDLDPLYRDAYRLLAVTLRELGDNEGSEQALAEWRAAAGGSPAVADLEEAYLRMGVQERSADGARLYWSGLDAARTPEETEAFLEDVKAIVEEDEAAEFEALDVEARKVWLRDFWDRQADAAVVPRDERLAEHYRRLAHVDTHFALAIPQRRHYSAITAFRPREQSGYDDRGVVYLRHGPPDDIARSAGPNLQRNESWLYERGEEGLVFHFVSDEDVEDFKLVNSLTDALVRGNATLGEGRNTAENVGDLFQSRARLDPIYNRLAFQFDPMLLREEEERVARDVKLGTTTLSYVPDSPDSLPFYAFPAFFRSPSGTAELSLFFGVPTGELEMPTGADGARLAFAAHAVVADEDGREVAARGSDSLTARVAEAPSREGGVLVPDVLQLPVQAGELVARLRVRDLISRATGTWTQEIEVPDLRGFSASSLVLASRVEPAAGPGKFVRGGLKIVPLPSLAFRSGQPVFVYYELYGLSASEDGRVRYRTEYTVRTLERKRNIAVKVLSSIGDLVGSRQERAEEVSLSVDGEGVAADRLPEYIALDLQASEPGPYELEVKVHDLVADRDAKRVARFVLSR